MQDFFIFSGIHMSTEIDLRTVCQGRGEGGQHPW